MNRVMLSPVGLLAASLLMNVQPVIADGSKPIEQITVEGRVLYSSKVNSLKSPTPIIDVPQSLSIISAEQIAKQGFTSVEDIVSYIPGVNISQGEGHRDAVVFRGVRSTADFFVDGVRDDVQYYRPLYNLEQVEVLRGPNALLFGRGGTGGVLNRVTKKGQLDEGFTRYKLGLDSFGAYNLEVDTNIAIDNSAALRFNAFYENLENHRDFYDGERLALNPTLKLNLGSSTTLDLSYEYLDFERFIDRGIPTGENDRPVESFADIVFGDPELNNATFEANVFRAMLQHNFSDDIKGNITVSFGDYDKFYENFYASGYDQEDSPDLVTLDGYLDETARTNFIMSGNLIGQLETGGLSHTFVAGAEFIDTSSDQFRFNSVWSDTGDDNETFLISRPLHLTNGQGVNAQGRMTSNNHSSDLNDDTRVNVSVNSVYLQDEIEVSEKLKIVIGARFDSFDIEVFNAKSNENRSRKDTEISPRGGIVFKPQENVSLYASYSESFLPRSGEQYDNLEGERDSLAPDVFENQEVGMKWDISNALSLTASYFENEQTRVERDNDTAEAFEERGLEIDGYEIQIQGALTDKLTVVGGYSHLDGTTGSGQRPRELPEDMFSLWGSYDISERFGLGLGATYQGESLITDGGSAVLPSYTRYDMAAYFNISETLRLQLNIENLSDKNYYPSAHSTHQASVGEPLNASFSLRGKF